MSLNPAENVYSAGSPFPPTYVRGRDNLAKLPIYRNGVLIDPVGANYVLYDPRGEELVNANLTIEEGVPANYQLTIAELPATAELSAAYQEVWTLEFSDRTQAFDREVVVARRALHPVVSDGDLTGVYRGLRRDLPSDTTTFQSWIDEAWKQIIGWLIGRGLYPHRMMSHEAFRTWHTHLALACFFYECSRQQAGRGNYLTLAETEQKLADNARDQLTFHADNDEDGKVDDVGERQAAARIVHVNAAPAWASRGTWTRF